MKAKKTKIVIIISVLAAVLAFLVLAAIVAGVIGIGIWWHNNNNQACEHVDADKDGKCDLCGELMQGDITEEQYEDKIEAISKYSITVAEGEGYNITAPEYVIMGNAATFTVEFSNLFDSSNAVVNVNGNAVTAAANGKYTVKNVQEDIEITVSGLVRTHYGVIKSVCPGVNIEGDDVVAVDGDYTFTLDISEVATGTPVVTANGAVITASADGSYTVSKPNRDTVIVVSGLTVPYVDVTYDATLGYSIQYAQTVVGESFSFSVHLNSEYENHIPLTVKVNGTVVRAVNGIYTVENAPQSVDIVVSGMSLREKITITFVNCELQPISIYKATIWQEIKPSREGYLFNGWKDANGYPVELDYLSDVTLYASWTTEDGVDYVNELPKVASKIKARYTALGDEWWRLTVADKALAELYDELLKCYSEYELKSVTEDAVIENFISKTENVSNVIIGKNNFYGANENAVQLYFTADGEYQNKGASTLRELASGHEMDGIEYNIQNKNKDNSVVLDYALKFGKINFKELCDTKGKVTFWLSTNAPGLSAEAENEYLFFSAEYNTDINTNKKYALYRIDIQDGAVFVNGEYVFDMSAATYNGENEFTINIHRLDIKDHQYAYIRISNVYTGPRDESLVKVQKTSQFFEIINMISASCIDPDTGLAELPHTDASKLFGELGGEYYNIQKQSTETQELLLDYTFTISGFNYKRYCEKYGSVSFKLASNYAGATVSIGNTLLFTSEADKPVTVTIQDGSVFVDGVYKCDLSADVYSGEAALVLNVHRTIDAPYAQFHISNITAEPKNTALVK